jgi:hypothetical protein
MEPGPVRLDQGEKLRQRSTSQSQKVGNVKRIEKKRINQDWEYLQKRQLSNAASTDEIFNAAYQKQGLQPQNLNEPISPELDGDESYTDTTPKQSRFSRVNEKQPKNPDRYPAANTDKNLIRKPQVTTPKVDKSSLLVKRGLAKGRVSAVNSGVFLLGSNIWLFIQLPLAVINIISFAAYAAIQEGLGYIEGAVAWWFDIEDIVGPLFAITGVTLHVMGIFILVMLYVTYRSVKLKPLSGNKAVLKQAAFAIALFGYSCPLLNLLPWGLLVVWVVWLYPE